MIQKPNLEDAIAITAFGCMGLILLLLAVVALMAVLSITPADWFKPVALVLFFVLPAVSAACVVASEVIR